MIFEDPQSNYQKTVNNLLSKRDFDFDRQLEFKDILGSLFLGLAPAVIQGAIQGVNERKFQRNKQIELLGQDAVDKITYDYQEQRRKLNIPEIELHDKNPDTYLKNKANENVKLLLQDDLLELGKGKLEDGFRIYRSDPESKEAYNKLYREFYNQADDDIKQRKLNPAYNTPLYELTSDIRRGIANNVDVSPETLVSIIGDRVSGKAAAEVEAQLAFDKLFPKYAKFNADLKAFEDNQVNQLTYLSTKSSGDVYNYLKNSSKEFDVKVANRLYDKIYDRFSKYEGNRIRPDRFSETSKPGNVRAFTIDGKLIEETTYDQVLDREKFKNIQLVRQVGNTIVMDKSNKETIHEAITNDMSIIAGLLIQDNQLALNSGQDVLPLTDEGAIRLSKEIIERVGFIQVDGTRGYKELFSGYVDNPREVREKIKLVAQNNNISAFDKAAELLSAKGAQALINTAPSIARYAEIDKITERNNLLSQLKSPEGRQLPEEQIEEMLDRINAIDFQINALRDMDAGVLQTMEEKEISDTIITEFLMNPPSGATGYAVFTNHNGNKQLINVATKFTTEEGRKQLYSFYTEEYGANPDLEELVNIEQVEEDIDVIEEEEISNIIDAPTTTPVTSIDEQMLAIMEKQSSGERLSRREKAVLRSANIEPTGGLNLRRFSRGRGPETRVVTEDLPVTVAEDAVDRIAVRPPLLAPSFDIFSDQQTGEEATNEAIDLAVKYGPDKETAKVFLNEIANVESQYGNAPNTFGKSDSKGHFQIDEIAFDEIQRRLRSDEEGQTLRDYNEKFMEDNGLDLRDISYDELDGRGLSAIFARLYLMRFTDKLPTNLRARANYWKNNYNTKAGAGSVRRYIEVVKAK